MGHQSFLYEQLTTRKLLQPGPYLDPPKNYYQCKQKNQRSPQSCPNSLSGHPPSSISPRRTNVLTQSPHERIVVACLTRLRQKQPRIPRAHWECHPQHHNTSGRWDRQKENQILHNQRIVKLRLPDHQPTLTVMSHWCPVLEGATTTHNMSNQLKTHPRAQSTRWISRDTQENCKWWTRSQREILMPSSAQWCSYTTLTRSKFQSLLTPIPTQPKSSKTMVPFHRSSPSHSCRNHPCETPSLSQTSLFQNLSVCRPNGTAYRPGKLGGGFLKYCFWKLTGYAQASGTLRGWSCFSQLSCNTPKVLITTIIFVREYCFDLISGIVWRLMNSWKTTLMRLRVN